MSALWRPVRAAVALVRRNLWRAPGVALVLFVAAVAGAIS